MDRTDREKQSHSAARSLLCTFGGGHILRLRVLEIECSGRVDPCSNNSRATAHRITPVNVLNKRHIASK